MPRRPQLRASDTDRERIAEVLRAAAAEGRLSTDELEHRLAAAFSARTYGELDALVEDLPGAALQGRPTISLRPWLVAVLALAIVIPLALAALAAALFVLVAGGFVTWLLWMAAAWWMFGRGRRRGAHIVGHRRSAMPPPRHAQPRMGLWL